LACSALSLGAGFQSQIKLVVGGHPAGVATGDFNQDGNTDIVVGQQNDPSIGVLLSNGDGTFQPAVSYAVGSQPVSITVADINRDGKLDLLVAEEAGTAAGSTLNTLGVLLGNGDGSFQPDVSYAEGRGPKGVVAGDFTGDGLLDAAIINYGFGSLVVLPGRGDGTFDTPGKVDTRRMNTPVGIAAGDFNHDHRMDVATSALGGSSPVAVRLGKGNGTFRAPLTLDSIQGQQVLAVSDLNADGNLDVVAGTDNSFYLAVFLGNGDGTFQPILKYAGRVYPLAVAIADFDGDGKNDVALVDGFVEGTVSVLSGNGDGTFASATSYSVGSSPVGVAVGDFNHDGRPDLAVSNKGDGTVSVLINAGATKHSAQLEP
jgi:hypothetical protein